jgi:hypothetical protein
LSPHAFVVVFFFCCAEHFKKKGGGKSLPSPLVLVLLPVMARSSVVEVSANGREVDGLGGGREESRLEG